MVPQELDKNHHFASEDNLVMCILLLQQVPSWQPTMAAAAASAASRVEVLVCGAGVVGLAIARAFAR